jgi:uncharacterized repeat protein (TIGR03837 family)
VVNWRWLKFLFSWSSGEEREKQIRKARKTLEFVLMPKLRWDIFCRVIDNWGDIGVCWRLSCALAARGQTVRLWVDDAAALAWMAPQGCAGVEVRAWQPDQAMPSGVLPGDVVIEAFGCEIDHAWIASKSIALHVYSMPANRLKDAQNTIKNPVWINLEYLSAESYSARSHGLASPVMTGAARGMTKWFFYPGFTEGTGGLIREPDAVMPSVEGNTAAQRISLFCYEPAALDDLLGQLALSDLRTELHVLPGRGERALQAALQRKNAQNHHGDLPAWNMRRMLSIHEQASMPQPHYDELLKSCDLNFVRGEDSLVRALWAGRAFVWQIYPQNDGAHAAKLEAFLEWLQAPSDLREFIGIWNGLQQAKLPPLRIRSWQACVLAARERLLAQPDLVSQLLDFAQEKRNSGFSLTA